MRTPAFVDRIDVADDADGRVAIFASPALEPPEDAAAEPASPADTPEVGSVWRRLGALLDARFALPVLGGVLVVVFVIGLLVTRH